MGNAPTANPEQTSTAPAKKQYLFYLTARESFLKDATDAERKMMFGHIRHLAALHQSGALVFGARYMTEPIALAVVEATSEAEARKLLESDPAVQAGILKMDGREIVMPFLEGRPAPKM